MFQSFSRGANFAILAKNHKILKVFFAKVSSIKVREYKKKLKIHIKNSPIIKIIITQTVT